MPFPRSTKARTSLIAAAAATVVVAGGATAVAVGPLGTDDRTAALAAQIDPAKPKNVILLIGDGTDEAIITAARNYEKGAGGRFAGLDALPFTGDMTTHGLRTGKKPNGQYPIAYVSDSAPTASAWSTGHKTVDGRLSQGPSESNAEPGSDYETVLETYRKQGKRTGNVTTSAITDATPAAAASHINARACQGPQDMSACAPAKKSAGGKGSVAEQLVDNKIDVVLGGGRNRYMQATDAGPTVLDYAKTKHGYRDLKTKADLDAVTSLSGGPVLGLFSGGTDVNPTSTSGENMKPLYEPLVATVPPGAGSPTQKCTTADRGTQPRLADMTKKAITLLEQGNDKGFFLQVESAMVDKQEHAIDACGAIGDLAELDRAVQVALEFQAQNPDTLIVVTGDHSHSTQIVDGTGSGRQTATLLTADGDPMYLAYSTGLGGSGHTGSQIRVAAKGPQAANVTGLIDQTDLYATLLGRTPSTLPETTKTVTVPGPTTTVEGPTTAVPGPTTTVPGPTVTAERRLSGGVAAPSSLTAAGARRGVPVTLLASKDGKAQVRLVRGGKTLATVSTAVKADAGRGVTIKPSRKATLGGKLQVRVSFSAGSERATATAGVRVGR